MCELLHKAYMCSGCLCLCVCMLMCVDIYSHIYDIYSSQQSFQIDTKYIFMSRMKKVKLAQGLMASLTQWKPQSQVLLTSQMALHL